MDRILHPQYLSVELSASGVVEREMSGRGSEGGIRVSSNREGASRETVFGAKPECGEEDWRTGGGGAEGRQQERGIRVRGRHWAEIRSTGWRTEIQKFSRKWERCFA